ncbi:hypothetical protein SAMD00019534_027830 [Acytostelium subglobosum LB1]|uniref:hypothetical protein n=1 Tax=Acytostelium subglobosum LB1 TaxID=1410327 RepID=UPI000644A275|nr:hypothetical protein SAMD00019534_027830 [Acytostelium subglobosum LB1]GAM19608.1 hypothetical protein SAMD00019534_027830 [Acytostelium subglobosum LB1]|eukprot:XP_012756370.1 hypothetical protein SAMD00019534_027830 [Acytostelium subglobosum LB1]
MGNISSIPDRMAANQKEMQAEMQSKQLANQLKLQDRMMKKQIALQVAITKERTYWFAGVCALGYLGLIAAKLRGKPVPEAAIPPLVGLTTVTAYQYDMAFGDKMNRVKKMAEEIEADPSYWFNPIEDPSIMSQINQQKLNGKMDIISIVLTVFVILLIIACILVDILRNNPQRPLSLKYRVRRFANWFSLGLSYSAMYIGRYNFYLLLEAKQSNGTEFITKVEYGWIMTIGYWTYALFSPFTGSLGDYFGPKPCVVLGVLGSGITNVTLGLALIGHDSPILKTVPPTLLFGFMNGLNFLMQSFATGSVSKINSTWYRRSELGVFGGIFSAVLATAYFFTLNVGGGILASPLPWNSLFILPGILLVISGMASFFIVQETPAKAGWVSIDLTESEHMVTHVHDLQSSNSKVTIHDDTHDGSDEHHNNSELGYMDQDDHHDELEVGVVLSDYGNIQDIDGADDGASTPKVRRTFKSVFKEMASEVLKKENLQPILSKENILNSASLFCIGWIKEGIISWYIPFLKVKFGDNVSDALLAICTAGVSIGAMTGGIFCGILSDYVFNSKRAPSLLIFFMLMNVLIVSVYFATNPAFIVIILYSLMIIMFGTNNVLSITALLDMGATRNAALMAGLLTMFQYVASGFSGFFLGFAVEKWGYGVWILSMIPFSLAAMVMMGVSGISDLLFWKKWTKLGDHKATPSHHSEHQIEFSGQH